jgi:hypothetical protein
MASNNSNYNKISIKTDSTVELIDQLAKLGFFKEKRKTKPKRATATGDIRQTGDMGPGYVRPILLQTTPGMTPQQIEDIQRRNNANIASLRAEVEQQRLEDFREITEPTSSITNIGRERFRGNVPSINSPFVQSTTIEEIPDIEEREMSQTINEGGPGYVTRPQIEAFGESEEEEGIPTGFFLEDGEALQKSEVSQPPPPRIEPIQRVFGLSNPRPVGVRRDETTEQMLERFRNEPGQNPTARSSLSELRNTVAREFGIGPVPDRDSSSSEQIRAYYMQLMDAAREEPDPNLTSKKKAYKGIIDYLDSIVNI